MAETPPGGPSYGQSASAFPGAPGQFSGVPSGPPSWASSAPRGASRLLTFVSLGISLIATVLAIVGWFRPVHAAPTATGPAAGPTYTEQQISDAKNRICAAIDTTHKGVVLQSGANKADAVSSDPALAEGQAANARLSIVSGSWYLRDHLDPATPQPLADTVKHLTEIMSDIGANYLAGARDADPAQSARLSDGDSTFAHALELCK